MKYLHTWLLALALALTPTLAFGQGDDTEADEEEESESDDGEESSEPSGPELIPEATAETEAKADAEAESEVGAEPEPEPVEEPEVEAEPEPEAEAEAEPATKDGNDVPAPAEPVAEPAPEPARKGRYIGLALSLGGGRIAAFDEGYQDLTDAEQIPFGSWGIDLWVMPRLSVSLSGVIGQQQSVNLADADGLGSLRIDPRVTGMDASVRFVPTPPALPIRPFVRAGGGFYRVHVSVTDPSSTDNLRQRDVRAATPYALLGAGVEITSPHRVRDVQLPFAAGILFEGGARLGGGGTVPAAPSVDLGSLGNLDLGPWYFRVAFVGSWVLTPKAIPAVPTLKKRSATN